MDIVFAQHDGFFKALMEQPGAAGALLRERLPKAIAEQLGPGEPELIDGTFIDAELRESRSDRLYRMQLKSGEQAYVYCLVEHKSAPDARIAWQLLRYMVRIWERIERESGIAGKLPPVIPLVVYHGAEEWKSPRRFSGMVEASEAMAAELLDFPFEVVDVGRVADEQLSGDPLLRVGLVVLKYAMAEAEGPPTEVVAAVLTKLRGVPEEFLRQAVRYIIGAYARMDEASLSSALRRAMPEKEKEMLSIAAREWLAQGKAEGEAAGIARGKAEALVRVLERRFGRVPAKYLQVISTAGPDDLDAWLDRAIDAPSVKTVFAVRRH